MRLGLLPPFLVSQVLLSLGERARDPPDQRTEWLFKKDVLASLSFLESEKQRSPPEVEGRSFDLQHTFLGPQGLAGLSGVLGFPPLAQGGHSTIWCMTMRTLGPQTSRVSSYFSGCWRAQSVT